MSITDHLQLSVLSAPLAATDRRALSQAWYSALYGATGEGTPKSAVAAQCSGVTEGAKRNSVRQEAGRSQIGRRPPARTVAERRSGGTFRGAAHLERRAPQTALARKIVRSFSGDAKRPQRASFMVHEGGTRVHVTIRSHGKGLSLIAVCSVPHRERVARALDQARYALASRGVSLHALLQTAVQC